MLRRVSWVIACVGLFVIVSPADSAWAWLPRLVWHESRDVLCWLAPVTMALLAAAAAARWRLGAPRSAAGLVLAASLPVLVLAIAWTGYRVEVGFAGVPEPWPNSLAPFRAEASWTRVASIAVSVAALTSAALVLSRYRATRLAVGGLIALALAGAGLAQGEALWPLRTFLELLQQLATLPFLLMPRGARTSCHASALVALLALGLFASSRERDPRRLAVALACCLAAIGAAAYPEALGNESPGFFCFTEPPGPASWRATVLASRWATLLAGLAMAVPVLIVGLARLRRWRSQLRDRAVVALAAAQALLPLVVMGLGFAAVRDEHLAWSDPGHVSERVEITLPAIEADRTWLRWGGDDGWPAVVADARGVRSARGERRWSELETRAGAAWARNAFRGGEERFGWREPRGLRVYADAAVPMGELVRLARAARLDGLSFVVDAPTRPFYEHLLTPDREAIRLVVWAGTPDARSSLLDGADFGVSERQGWDEPTWLAPGRILVDRPADGQPLGDWIESMRRAASERDANLLMLQVR